MSEIEKMYENANIKPEYRYDCNLADTIKPVEVFPLRSCSKGEIKDYCTNKQDYRYCKVYKVNKIYPLFTAEKQIKLIKMFCRRYLEVSQHIEENGDLCFGIKTTIGTYAVGFGEDFVECLAGFVNCLWTSLSAEERQQVKEILE